MWPTTWHKNRWLCAVLAGLCMVLGYAPFSLFPFAFLHAFFLTLTLLELPERWRAFKFSYLTSFVLLLGGFYWVTYVIHVFGFLPWWFSFVLFLGFCGIGALNYPVFGFFHALLYRRIHKNIAFGCVWGVPALFTLCEYGVGKLFPWGVGHALFRVPLLFQICDLTGAYFLTFLVFQVGASFAGFVYYRNRFPKKQLWVPVAIWVGVIGYGIYRLHFWHPETRPLKVALVQGNIGSLDKLKARKGLAEKIQAALGTYYRLTEELLQPGNSEGKPDLIVWPETAAPVKLDNSYSFLNELKHRVVKWNIPLITGGYATSWENESRDYNAAGLFDLIPEMGSYPPVKVTIGPKNILLAYGEYMPFGDKFPFLYKWFPEVANFERGKIQTVFKLHNGLRAGLTICYEAIVPEFVRQVAVQSPDILLNLTNDSWFGPTSEPLQHAQLSIFRAVEIRRPLLRVTNTGITFSTDIWGRFGEQSKIQTESAKIYSVDYPYEANPTFYTQYGDWAMGALAILLLAVMVI